MGRSVVEQLTDAVRAFNIRAEWAKRRRLPFIVEAQVAGEPGHGGFFHLKVLRSLPVAAELSSEARGDHCAAEIALLSAAEEVSRLVNEAWKQNVKIELRVEAGGWAPDGQHVELRLPAYLRDRRAR